MGKEKKYDKPGRPFGTFKYDTEEELEICCDKYFAECNSKPVLDADGNQITDRHGKPTFFPPVQPTMEDLALALNVTTRTLENYGKEDKYFRTINRARQKVLAANAQRLYDKDGVNGAKFVATNNSERMGGLRYADRQEVGMDIAPISFTDDLGV